MDSINSNGNVTQSGKIWVFFRSAAQPTHPSYVIFDPAAANWSDAWSDVITVSKMTLAGTDGDGNYYGDPRAVLYKNNVYLFCRGWGVGDNGVLGMKSSGGNWSDPQSLPLESADTITPHVLNNNLYIFHRVPSDFCIHCEQLDENFNQLGSWSSEYCDLQCQIAVDNVGTVYFNSNNVLNAIMFSGSAFFDGPYNEGYGLGLGPSVVCASGYDFAFFRGFGDDAGLYLDGKVVDGVDMLTAPSALLVDHDKSYLTFLVFYVGNDELHNLKVSLVYLSDNTPTLIDTWDSGLSVAPENCSPFAVMIP
jgi:hypothetical protein